MQRMKKEYRAGWIKKIPQERELIVHHSLEFGEKLDVRKLFVDRGEKRLAHKLDVLPLPWGDDQDIHGCYALILAHKLADQFSIPRGAYSQYLHGKAYVFLDNPIPPYKKG